MCTIVLLRSPGQAWPLLVAANRDEMLTREALPPGRHWPDQPDVVAGRDLVAGGTWLGLNDQGLIAAISNRRGSLGPTPGLRSRGELPLMALAHGSAASAAEGLAALDAGLYRPFNLVLADRCEAYLLCNREGAATIESSTVPTGLSMLTAAELDDQTSPRIRHYLPQFQRATPPAPDSGDWAEWQALLASHQGPDSNDSNSAMNVSVMDGFGTVSSSLIAVPDAPNSHPVWLFADGRPDEAPYRTVDLGD